MYPWELNPDLTQDRLVTLARAAVTTRNRAFAEADRAAGDTNWGLACKAHERLMHCLGHLAGGGEHPWLTVIRDGLYLMPRIDDVPVRVFRGTPDRPGSRHLDALRLEHERAQPARPQMAFDFMGGAVDDGTGPWYWLMAMETGDGGMVSRVVFFQANDAGETRYPWECPLVVEERAAVVAVEVAAPVLPVVVEAAAPPVVAALVAATPIATEAAPRSPSATLFGEEPAPPARGEGARGRGRRAGRGPSVAPQQAELWGAAAAE